MEQMPEVDAAVHARWRLALMVALIVMALMAAVSTALTIASGGAALTRVCLWAGVVLVALAWRSVPRGVRRSERPAMRRSAVFVALAIVCSFVLPLVLERLGVGQGA